MSLTQISYNDVLSRGFSQKFDIEGDEIVEESLLSIENSQNHEMRRKEYLAHKKLVSYEDKLRSINAKVERIMEEGELQMRLESSDEMVFNIEGYYDANEIKKFSLLYERTLQRLFTISKRQSLNSLI